MKFIKVELKKNNREYIDILRVGSMISVIFLHSASGILRGDMELNVWWFSNIATSLMTVSVPIFFMISGAGVLSSKRTISVEYTLKKRIPRALLPFLVWSIVALVYFLFIGYKLNHTYDLDGFKRGLIALPGTPTTIHLWFMYALIPIYLISPLIKSLMDGLSDELKKYLLIIWLFFPIINTLITFLPETLKPILTLDYTYRLDFIGGYLGYFILGFYLFEKDIKIELKKLVLIAIFMIGVIALGTYYISFRNNMYLEQFKSYTSVYVVVLSVLIFLIMKKIDYEKLYKYKLYKRFIKIINFLSKISFGVYLIHNLIIHYLQVTILNQGICSIRVLLLLVVVTTLISIVTIMFLSSFKLTCFIFTGLLFDEACNSCNFIYLKNKIICNIKNNTNIRKNVINQ